ncbi:hypothetical protein G7Y89_g2679 [Cudoniella acicularis]|uniref:Uncharacterized protein n=1 Tax=Cudoniella acicularis TaxID=354080 RepID=A0A8H4RSW1_9HELO|nr:hypothetical protein G7Y89_g2679 [Cudoniella acicularis]
MASSDEIFDRWHGIVENDFTKTIAQTFDLPPDDSYVYRAESFGMKLLEIEEKIESGGMNDRSRGPRYQKADEPASPSRPLGLHVTYHLIMGCDASADIDAYTSLFLPTTDTSKALKPFSSNAKKNNPRMRVTEYLEKRRIASPFKILKSKTHLNPYLDLWALSCHLVEFTGPLDDPGYESPASAKLVGESAAEGVIDMASGNGYWTYILRRMKIDVLVVDNMTSEYRTMWILDTVKGDGVEYLKKSSGGKGRVLLMIYMITAGTFTKRILKVYQGNVIVMVGTQNRNRYTGFSHCTMEKYFNREMKEWELVCRIAMLSFAGKDEALYAWKRKPSA